MNHGDSRPLHASDGDSCPSCGASAVGGGEGCQALFNELNARVYGNVEYAATHDLLVDSYCMQHPELYCRSAKSYAAHLTRLCCGLEYGAARRIYASIQNWLNGALDLEKPEAPENRGQVTVADVRAARNLEEYTEKVHEWARSVWEAYQSQHRIAHGWIEAALGRSG